MKKIYIYIFSIFLLFITNVNSVENFEEGKAYQLDVNLFEVPQNEQWMVDRLSEQYPELEDRDIYRIQTSFGTYYGAINNRGLPHGPGILSVSKDGVPTGTALEAEFKKGKLNDTDQFTLLGITDRVFEINNEDMMVAAKNRVFNNGFDLIANVNNLIKESISRLLMSLSCYTSACERVYFQLENINNHDFSDNPIHLIIELENLLFDMLVAKDVNRYRWQREREIAQRPAPIDPFLSVVSLLERTRKNNLRNNFLFYEDISNSISNILGFDGANSGIREFLSGYKERDYSLIIGTNDPLYFSNQVLNGHLRYRNENRYRESDDNKFEEFRIVNNFNFRKNENEDVIQGKLNEKWYDLELNPETMAYEMTASARRDFENNSGDRGSDGGGEGGW